MNIELEIHQRYKSFQGSMYATNLNPFIVLTGKNGAGKSQLLDIISKHYSEQFQASVTIDDYLVKKTDILSILDWSMPKAASGGLGTTQGRVNEVFTALMSIDDGGRPAQNKFSDEQTKMILTISEQLHKDGFHRRTGVMPTLDHVAKLLPDNFFHYDKFIVNEKVAAVIFEWHLNATEEHRSFDTPDNPITVFNELCKDFDMNFTLPSFESVRYSYDPKLRDQAGTPIGWDELSSGEQVIFRLICWLFFHKLRYNLYPKLILLDEPDAHLNPKMIRKLVDSIQSVLVEQLGIRVVMTTHSPNTVALCDETALYELKRLESTHEITKIARKIALAKFSDGLLFVQEDNRLVFVEGIDDVTFYNELYRLSAQYHGLSSVPSFNFIAASTANPDHGGVQEVIKMIPRFSGSSVESLVYGLIDSDGKNLETDKIKVLKRYALENYFYDPFIILMSLIIHGKHRGLVTCLSETEIGDYESVLNDPVILQTAINEILDTIKNTDPILTDQDDKDNINALWHVKRSRVISYYLPRWFTELKKDSLLQSLRHPNNPNGKFIDHGKQLVAIKTLGAVPEDVLDIFKTILI